MRRDETSAAPAAESPAPAAVAKAVAGTSTAAPSAIVMANPVAKTSYQAPSWMLASPASASVMPTSFGSTFLLKAKL